MLGRLSELSAPRGVFYCGSLDSLRSLGMTAYSRRSLGMTLLRRQQSTEEGPARPDGRQRVRGVVALDVGVLHPVALRGGEDLSEIDHAAADVGHRLRGRGRAVLE